MLEIGRLTRLELGYVGETESRSIQIDVSEWLERWPQAVIAIWVRRPDKTGYTAATEVEDGILTWNVTAGDVAQAGDGMAQIKALDPMDTGAIYKSRTVATKIYASLEEMSSDPDAPDPMESWANQAAIYKEEAYRAKEAAQAAAAEANASAENAAESEARSAASAKSANDEAMAATDAANEAIKASQTSEAAQGEAAKAAAAAAESAERAASAEKAAGDAADVATSKANAAEESASTAEEARREASVAASTAATEARAATTAASEAKKSAAAADLAREKAETNAGTAVQAMTRAEAGAAQSEQNAATADDAKEYAASAAKEATDSAANAKSNAEDAKSHAEAAAEHAQTAEDAAKLAKESAADTAPAIEQQSSGEVVAISDGAARPALSLVSQIVAVQRGTGDPSPDHVRPITGWDALTLTRTGRNMLDPAALRLVQIRTGETRWGMQYTRPGTYALHANVPGGDADYVYARVTDGSGAEVGNTMHLVTGSSVRRYAVTLVAGQTLTVWYVRDLDQATAAECLTRTQVQVEMSSRTDYVPGQSAAITAELPETVYGGTLDWMTGLLTVTHGHIEAYAGEDVPEGCISSVGALTDGAQVVYPLASPYTIQLAPKTLALLRGDNVIWSDCGNTAVAYVADTKTYVDAYVGSVASVNGKTGAVVLNAADVGAMPADAQIVDADAREQIAQLKDDVNLLAEEVDHKVDGTKSQQLFNKNTATSGYYVSPAKGNLIENANFCATDFIEVEEGKTYSCTTKSNCAYYKADKTYLQSAGSDNPFTVPSNAKYIRCSISKKSVDTFMFNEGSTLLPYEDYGSKLSIDNFNDALIKEIKVRIDSGSKDIDQDYLSHVRKHLDNPFVKTQIKLVGDSITAGHAGTGYDTTGTSGVLIGGTTNSYQNVITSVCWSNMLYHYIDDVYNRIVEVSLADERISKPSMSSQVVTYGSIINGVRVSYNGVVENNAVAGREFLEFQFFGNEFDVYFDVSNDFGIFDVYVDGALHTSVDCYSEEDGARHKVVIDGLSNDKHTVSFKCTATKNENSSAKQVRVTGLAVTKTAMVVPWGIGGTTSNSALNTNGRYTTDDDFVILQYGTNDRHIFTTADMTTQNLIAAGEMLRDTYGAEPIFMCACPANEHYESNDDVPRYYNMWDVHDAIKRVCDHFGVPMIDNYTAFMDYAEQHNISTDDLLADGLHPNDLGYRVMFSNIMKCLGLARLPHYKEWKPVAE